MTTLGNSELLDDVSLAAFWYRPDCLGFSMEETIRYTVVILLSTVVLRLQLIFIN